MTGYLFDADRRLYDSMQGNYTSEAEHAFFEAQHQKALHPIGGCEVLVRAEDNPDGIWLIHCLATEYEIGLTVSSGLTQEIHTMSLAELLDINLRDAGFLNRDISVLDWLREHDFFLNNPPFAE